MSGNAYRELKPMVLLAPAVEKALPFIPAMR